MPPTDQNERVEDERPVDLQRMCCIWHNIYACCSPRLSHPSALETPLMTASSAALRFAAHVGEPVLIAPEVPTPYEFKYLSNLDDQAGLRNHLPFVHFYRRSSDSPAGHDPAPVIRHALSRALVHYYPLAGRLRNGERGKLVVECNGEGVVFREADAEVSLAQLRPADGPPFPWWEQFLVDDVFGYSLITDSPLLRMQVTRLSCGGFVLAYTINHCMCDTYGALQFISAVAEIARRPSLPGPSLIPVWDRENLAPRRPPRVSFHHPAYVADPYAPADDAEFRRLAQTSCFFSRADVSALKRRITKGSTGKITTFEAVAACLWCARSRALALSGDLRLLIPSDIRSHHRPALDEGYYGAGIVILCVSFPAAVLKRRPLGGIAGRISAEKALVLDREYRASAVDFLETEGRGSGYGNGPNEFGVSDMSRLRFADVDVGWGGAEYGGAARAGSGPEPGMMAVVVGHRRRITGEAKEGEEEGLLVLLQLPLEAVDAFHKEVRQMVKGKDEETGGDGEDQMDDPFPALLSSAL